MYDVENRLSQVSVTKDGKTAVIQQNIYNGEGQRTQKIDGNVLATERFQQNATQYYLYNKDIRKVQAVL